MNSRISVNPQLSTGKYLGVDNGKHGGIVVLDGQTNEIDAWYAMPVLKGDKTSDRPEYDVNAIAKIFARHARDIRLCTLEKVFVMPKIAKMTAMQLGWCLGLMEALCAANNIPYIIAQPQTWQKKMFAGLSYTDTKTMSLMYAKRLLPDFDWNCGEKAGHDGISDAYCLALYGKQTLFGS